MIMHQALKCRFIFALFILRGGFFLHAQENKPGHSIEFVRQIPSGALQEKAGVFQKLLRLFSGKPVQKLVHPYAAIADRNGVLWVIDQQLHALCTIEQTDQINVTALKSVSRLPSPIALAWFGQNRILLTDSELGRIYYYNTKTNKFVDFAPHVKLIRPTGIAVSPDLQAIWVVDTAAHQVVVLSPRGELVKRIGHRGSMNAEFNYPTFICSDDSFFYVVDSMNFRVQLFDPGGKFLRSFGEIGDDVGYLSRPKGIAVDTFGHIYIVDSLQHNIQVFDKNGAFLYAWGGLGTKPGQFWLPSTIFIDQQNTIYVADTFNKRFQVFRLISGTVNE